MVQNVGLIITRIVFFSTTDFADKSIYMQQVAFFLNETVLSITDPSNKYLLTSLYYYVKKIIIRLFVGNG